MTHFHFDQLDGFFDPLSNAAWAWWRISAHIE